MRSYYYFITSLKDISFETEKLPYSLSEFIDYAFYEIDDRDVPLLKSILYQYDNKNLVNVIDKKDDFNSLGVFSRNILEEEVKDPERLPSYMISFIKKLKDDERALPQYSLEDELTIHYYRYLRQLPNKFLADYVAFDFNIKNVIAALNARKFRLELDNSVLLLDEYYQDLVESRASDFGLVHDYEWLQDVLNIFEEPHLVEREKDLIEFRFKYIDDKLKYDYFNINKVLGYFIKLLMLERLLSFDEQKGKEIFDQITNQLSDDKIVFAQLSN